MKNPLIISGTLVANYFPGAGDLTAVTTPRRYLKLSLRKVEEVIGGVLATFSNIIQAKVLEAGLHGTNATAAG